LCPPTTWHGRARPRPDLAGAAALGLVPDQCIVFEDASAGIRPHELLALRTSSGRIASRDEDVDVAVPSLSGVTSTAPGSIPRSPIIPPR
jgi:hypothetical protein